jgi:hypothetical protein
MWVYVFKIGGAIEAQNKVAALHKYSVDFAREADFTEILVLFSLNLFREFFHLLI